MVGGFVRAAHQRLELLHGWENACVVSKPPWMKALRFQILPNGRAIQLLSRVLLYEVGKYGGAEIDVAPDVEADRSERTDIITGSGF